MSSKSAAEVHGFEYDWIGSDADGHVALFSTAGGGYTPAEFLRDTDAHKEAIETILASPVITTARFAPEMAPSGVNTWLMVAERGLFAFDGDPNNRDYSLVAAPEVPLQAAQLPALAAKVLHGLEFRHLHFAQLSVITEQDLTKRSRRPR